MPHHINIMNITNGGNTDVDTSRDSVSSAEARVQVTTFGDFTVQLWSGSNSAEISTTQQRVHCLSAATSDFTYI